MSDQFDQNTQDEWAPPPPLFPTGQAPGGFGGGAVDWLSGLAPILGAIASFRNPAAGAAIFGVGDYMRRQRMAELAQQRQQRLETIQQQRDTAMRAQLQSQGLDVPEGMSAQDMIRWASDERLRKKTEFDVARQQKSGAALTGILGLDAPGATMDPRTALQSAIEYQQNLAPEALGQAMPILNRLREQAVRQGQAENMLPAPRPPEQYGPSQVDPEDIQRAAAMYARGEIPSIPAWLERTGRNPMLAGPEGRKYVTEQTKLGAERSTAVSEQMKQDIVQRRALGLPISYAEAQLIGAAGPMPAIPDEATRAALAAGVSPWDIAWMPPEQRAQAAGTAQSAFSAAEARRAAERIRTETPAKVSQEYALIPPAAAKTRAVGGAETDVLSARGKRLAQEKVDYPEFVPGPFETPEGGMRAGMILTPRQRAAENAPLPISEKDQQARVDLANTMTTVGIIDELSKKIITARTPAEAQEQAFRLNVGAGIPIPFTGTRLSIPYLRDPLANTYAAEREGFLGQLARTFGAERGVLTNQDVMRVSALVADFGDQVAGRELKSGLMSYVMGQAKANLERKIKGLPMLTYDESGAGISKVIVDALARAGVADPTTGKTPEQIDNQVETWKSAAEKKPPREGEPLRRQGWGTSAAPVR